MHAPETHLIPLALAASTANGPELQIYGSDYPTPDGTCIRDYIHVNDLADAHVRALQYLESNLEENSAEDVCGSLAINLGTGQGHSVLEVIQAAESAAGRRFGERSDRGGRAILRSSWPIRRRLKSSWDGPPSAILPASFRVRGVGCRKIAGGQRLGQAVS